MKLPKRYTVTNNGHRIQNVPIFAEHQRTFQSPRGPWTFDCGYKWLKNCIDTMQRRINEGYEYPIIAGHHDVTKPSEERPILGRYDNLSLRQCQYDGKLRWVVFADLVLNDPKDLKYIRRGRSPEISNVNEPELDALAVMSSRAPFFKFPVMQSLQVQNSALFGLQAENDNVHLGREEESGKTYMAFGRCDRQGILCYQAGGITKMGKSAKSAQYQEPLEEGGGGNPMMEILTKILNILETAESKASDMEAESYEDEDEEFDEEDMPVVEPEVEPEEEEAGEEELEEGEEEKEEDEEEDENADYGEVGKEVPFKMPTRKKGYANANAVKKMGKYSAAAYHALQGELAALRKRLDDRDRHDKNSVLSDRAYSKCIEKGLIDPECDESHQAFYAAAADGQLKGYITALKHAYGADLPRPYGDESPDAGLPEPVRAYTAFGPEAIQCAQKLHDEFASKNRDGSVESYIALGMEDVGIDLAKPEIAKDRI